MYDWINYINIIKEIYPGHYQIILNFATVKFLPHLIKPNYAYVWVLDHRPFKSRDFQPVELPVSGDIPAKVFVRQMSFDFVMPTAEAVTHLERFDNGISLVQLNFLPKYYIDSSTMSEQTFYNKLKEECDYLFHLDVPAAPDYGRLISSNKEFLEGLLKSTEIDWTNLP